MEPKIANEMNTNAAGMASVAGFFSSREAAEKAARALQLPAERAGVIAPAPRVPEDEGIGEAIGGVLGGSIGIAAGSMAGPAALSVLLPGVGPVVAIGIGALVLGGGGLAAGLAAGKKVDERTHFDQEHDPRDVFYYHEALRRGRAIVLAFAERPGEAEQIRARLAAAGGEDLESFRESWWSEVRGPEDFRGSETEYRLGFESALDADRRNETRDENTEDSAAFREGFRRGHEYFEKISAQGVAGY